jgi:hypothetical protein
VKSLKTSFDVIPAKAGIQCFQIVLDACLRRACPCGGRGMTEFHTFYEFVNIELSSVTTLQVLRLYLVLEI